MNQLQIEIKNCLVFFGPCDLRTIQQKLDMRGMVKSQNDIDNACQELIKQKAIREASGFDDIAYKI